MASMGERLVVIGGGGMGRGVLDVIDAINYGVDRYEVLGIVAEPEPDVQLLSARGVKYLGGLDALADLPADVGYVIGIGNGQVRRRIDQQLMGRPCPVLVHPNAHVGFDVQLGPGVVVCSHVSIESNIRLGRHVHVNQNSTIGHDTVLADYVTVSPLTAISGNVTAGEAVFFGTGSCVREKVSIGAEATVGMGAAVVDDVDAAVTVKGVPAVPGAVT